MASRVSSVCIIHLANQLAWSSLLATSRHSLLGKSSLKAQQLNSKAHRELTGSLLTAGVNNKPEEQRMLYELGFSTKTYLRKQEKMFHVLV